MSINSLIEENIDENYNKLCFDSLPLGKLIFLSIITFGLYEVVWFYNLWKRIAVDLDVKISPFWRAIFSGISAFWLFPILNKYFTKINAIYSFKPVLFAIIYLILNGFSRLPEPYEVICMFTLVIPVLIQSKINSINKQYFPVASVNTWNVANTVWTVVSILVITLVMIGSLISY